jgi:hypothetical protein
MQARNAAETLGEFLFIDGRLADVGFGTADVKEPVFAKIHGGQE